MNKQEFEFAKRVLFDIGKSINEETRMSKNSKSFAVSIVLNKLSDLSDLNELNDLHKQAKGGDS